MEYEIEVTGRPKMSKERQHTEEKQAAYQS